MYVLIFESKTSTILDDNCGNNVKEPVSINQLLPVWRLKTVRPQSGWVVVSQTRKPKSTPNII